MVDSLVDPFMRYVDSGEGFHNTVRRIYRQVTDWLGRASLQIAVPAEGAGEFLIGDCPAVTVRYDRASVGPLGGIALKEANTVMLPLGPRHLAAVARRDEFLALDAPTVDLVNSAQVSSAVEHVYYRPAAISALSSRSCGRTPTQPEWSGAVLGLPPPAAQRA